MNERYNGLLPPKISEQKLNNYIKIIGEKAGINSQIRCEITRNYKKSRIQSNEENKNCIIRKGEICKLSGKWTPEKDLVVSNKNKVPKINNLEDIANYIVALLPNM